MGIHAGCFGPKDPSRMTPEEKTAVIRSKARKGDAKAQYLVGWQYATGMEILTRKKIKVDYVEAEKWYRKSALQGYAEAQNSLGVLYAGGQGVPQDHKQAVEWFRKAANQGNIRGQYNLGMRYFSGKGVARDYKQSAQWIGKASNYYIGSKVPKAIAEADGIIKAQAQAQLGFLYLNGLGVKKDYAESLKWYQKAADKGDPFGQAGVGFHYEKGWVVEKDHQKAREWYQKAIAQGNRFAKERLELMELFDKKIPEKLK